MTNTCAREKHRKTIFNIQYKIQQYVMQLVCKRSFCLQVAKFEARGDAKVAGLWDVNGESFMGWLMEQ